MIAGPTCQGAKKKRRKKVDWGFFFLACTRADQADGGCGAPAWCSADRARDRPQLARWGAMFRHPLFISSSLHQGWRASRVAPCAPRTRKGKGVACLMAAVACPLCARRFHARRALYGVGHRAPWLPWPAARGAGCDRWVGAAAHSGRPRRARLGAPRQLIGAQPVSVARKKKKKKDRTNFSV